MSCSVATSGGSVKHGDISTTAMDISFSILFEFYFIFSLYFEALLPRIDRRERGIYPTFLHP